jgi:SAM-dependent methyltransferase
MSRFYPKDYWTFEKQRMRTIRRPGGLAGALRRRRCKYWLTDRPDPLGRLLAAGSSIPRHLSWARRAGIVSPDVAVLDVGCGLGDRLLTLRQEGFRNLTGVDPFIAEDIVYEGGVRVHRCDVHSMSGHYDYITLHHSFEHMPEPARVMKKLQSLLSDTGTILIRVPVASSYAWEHYRTNWVQLDAPRHLFLQTAKSMGHLARSSGLQIVGVHHDADMFQFWGSEQYARDIPLYDERSYEVNPQGSVFTEEQIAAFRKRSIELNHSGRGDQACFYLRKT